MTEWFEFFKAFGFAAGIAVYVLVRLESSLRANTMAINDLRVLITRLLDKS